MNKKARLSSCYGHLSWNYDSLHLICSMMVEIQVKLESMFHSRLYKSRAQIYESLFPPRPIKSKPLASFRREVKLRTTLIVVSLNLNLDSHHSIESPPLLRSDLQLRHILLKMLARSCLRSSRAVGGVRNGAINISKVRQTHHSKATICC